MSKPKTKKITMTVFCLPEDAEEVLESLNGPGGWYFEHPVHMTGCTVTLSDPTKEEDKAAAEKLGY